MKYKRVTTAGLPDGWSIEMDGNPSAHDPFTLLKDGVAVARGDSYGPQGRAFVNLEYTLDTPAARSIIDAVIRGHIAHVAAELEAARTKGRADDRAFKDGQAQLAAKALGLT